jgi:hypothetical protein
MARRKAPYISDELLDRLLSGTDAAAALQQGGLLDGLKKALAERALNAEMDHHLDGEGGARNGYGRKTVLTDSGRIALEVPRDRHGSYDPQLIAKYQRRFPGFDEKIVSMYARGMSTREIAGHVLELYGVEVSADLVSAVRRRIGRPFRSTSKLAMAAFRAASEANRWCRSRARIQRSTTSTPASTLALSRGRRTRVGRIAVP